MSSAVQSALAGLATAGQRLEKSAAAVARGGARMPAEGTAQTPRSAAAARAENAIPGMASASAGPDAPSLADGLFAMQQAEMQYKASAKLLGALDAMQKETLDRLG